MNPVDSIINEIRRFRDRYDVSARELAIISGLSPHTIINVLTHGQGRIENLRILHDTMQVALAQIAEESKGHEQQAAEAAPLAGLARS